MDIRTILDIILGSGVLGIFLFYESKKRKERAQARSSELENINMVISQKNSYIDDLKNEQLDLKKEKEELRAELREARSNEGRDRNKLVVLYKQVSNLNVDKVKMREQIDILKFQRCEVQDCPGRKPPKEIN